jgi:membrane-associated protein
MDSLMQRILSIPPVWVYVTVTLLVFAEDAIFVGFVLPGETAAVLGGVAASQHHVALWAIIVLVVGGAIVGDSVGYEVGRHFGARLLSLSILDGHRGRIDRAQGFLARRGGWAVFLGRFTAFFRAVMPALVGSARMPYRKFLTFNAAGGVIWGGMCVVLGYAAGHSYAAVSRNMGRGMAVAVAVVVVCALIAWRVREYRRTRQTEREFRTNATSDEESSDNLHS